MAGASKARRYILSPLLRARSRCATTISQRNGTTSQADGFDRRHRRRARQARAVSVGHQPHGPASRRVWGEVITFRCVWRGADSVAIGPNLDLAKLAGDGSIVVGDVRQVPVGKCAKAALEKLGAWQAAAPKLAMAINTRVALTMVARGEAPLGIVYTTDANGARYCGDRRPRCVENLDVLRPGQSAAAEVSASVKIIGTFPADSHPPIVYPVAGTLTAKPEAVDYLAYLRSMTAKAIFEQYGFTFLLQPAS